MKNIKSFRGLLLLIALYSLCGLLLTILPPFLENHPAISSRDGEASYFPRQEFFRLLNAPDSLKEQWRLSILVINGWATWCKPCLEEIPDLNQLRETFANRQDIVFLALTTEDSFTVNAFFQKRNLSFSYTILANQPDALFEFLGKEGKKKNFFFQSNVIPFHFIISESDSLLFAKVGASNEYISSMEKILKQVTGDSY